MPYRWVCKCFLWWVQWFLHAIHVSTFFNLFVYITFELTLTVPRFLILQERFYFGDNVLPCFESGIPLLLNRLQQLPDSDNVISLIVSLNQVKLRISFPVAYTQSGFDRITMCWETPLGVFTMLKLLSFYFKPKGLKETLKYAESLSQLSCDFFLCSLNSTQIASELIL